jgi:tetratricopeptide (TPR) repeat protein
MIETIKEKARLFDWSDHKSVISFYESNKLFFEKYEDFSAFETIIDVINMKSHYIAALISTNKYKKALTYIDHIDFLLNKIKENNDEFERLSIRNLFHKGVIFAYLKKTKLSYEIFQKLKRLDPENEQYKDWFDKMKNKLFFKKVMFFGYLGLAIVCGDLISGLAFNYNLDKRVVLLGFILILLTWLIPTVMRYMRKKKITPYNK